MNDRERLADIEYRVECVRQKKTGYMHCETFGWHEMEFVLNRYNKLIIAMKSMALSIPGQGFAATYYKELARETLEELGEANETN